MRFARLRCGRCAPRSDQTKEVVVASRWRIRHKLMLGLGLVVAIMALLLCGTSRGLWSYYDTTNRIRAKLAEKEAADELKGAIARLVAPHNLARLLEERGRTDSTT